MADLNADISDELMFRFKAALGQRKIKLVKTGVALALEDWIAKDPTAPTLVHDGSGGSPVQVSSETLELARALQTLFQTQDPKWSGIASFLRNEVDVFAKEITLK